MNSQKFILASASPRRRELLEEAGYIFDIVPSGVDEEGFKSAGLTPAGYTEKLAGAKAEAVAEDYPDIPVLGSDCIVELEGEIFEKPEDGRDAERIIRTLFSSPHNVITSVAVVLRSGGRKSVRTAITRIYPAKLTQEQISHHISTGKWRGRSGGYGVQDPHTEEYIEKIEGSFTNVVGLPMELTSEMLKEFGITPELQEN
ncbi:Maf-like protein YhdE [Sedimentisphaera cyanobacteriorum]|uniref:Nucleoside triphosphate pyrophosphatase n=1 Tax=Sedimentisphaera cyanobacteriorum TaxID=1940790 RepID=A0A1Q2HQB8_9BACT|nr:nucleoside triphosphate pyrophosphatase [Sedimentisphaera cyanobacteriorum]AQQ09560.1 Maf-like protein YhdE [Sedimentisphaera cyanobacteriorum]